MRDQASSILLKGKRDHLNRKDEGKSSCKYDLTDNEITAFKWLIDSFVDYILLPKTDCPHQASDMYVTNNDNYNVYYSNLI